MESPVGTKGLSGGALTAGGGGAGARPVAPGGEHQYLCFGEPDLAERPEGQPVRDFDPSP